jgi:hypothetical protein
VLGRIVRDEAAHGAFGFSFLDWAIPQLASEEIAHLGRAADIAIRAVHRIWSRVGQEAEGGEADLHGDALAWMGTTKYLETAHRAMERRVREPLRARGVPVSA